MERKLRVFVSSAIEDYIGHRDIVLKQINENPILDAYVFEQAPAKAGSLTSSFSQTYIAKLRDSDIVVVVLGKELRPPVLLEVETSLKLGLPILLFFEERFRDAEHAKRVVAMTGGKYQTFMRATELSDKVVEAVNDYIIETVRSYRV